MVTAVELDRLEQLPSFVPSHIPCVHDEDQHARNRNSARNQGRMPRNKNRDVRPYHRTADWVNA